MIEFYEERFKQGDSTVDIDSLMTEEEQKRVAYYIDRYEDSKRKMAERMVRWELIDKLYKGERQDKSVYSNNGREINVILPQIEGQVSSLMNNNISGSYKGVGYSDQKFAETCGKVGEFILSQNKMKLIVKKFARRYLKYGTSVLTVNWDEEAFDKFGIPVFETPRINQVFVDDKIDDVVMDYEKADWIIHEVGAMSIDWARSTFGDDIADAVTVETPDAGFEFEGSKTNESFTYLRIWTKNNEKRELELLEVSSNGILLKRKTPNKLPFYTNVFNKYPFFFAGMYHDESDCYYFGDGEILVPYQELINKLLDTIIRAIEFSSMGRTYVDPRSQMNPEDFTLNDPSVPVYARNPHQFIRTERGTGVNDVVFVTMDRMLQEVQKVTRFSSLMTGNRTGEEMTATQAGIQLQQGATGVDDKKSDLSYALGKALTYAIGLCMQYWNSAKAFRIADNENRFEWIDVRQFKNIPEMIPATSDYRQNFRNQNPEAEAPEFMQATREKADGTTENITKQLEMDIVVNIGEGLPNNKIAMYNLVLSLAQIQLFDETTGQVKPAVGYNKFCEMVESYLGINLMDKGDENERLAQLQQQVDAMAEAQGMEQGEEIGLGGGNTPPMQAPLNINPNIPGANMNGTAMGGFNG